MNAAEKLQMMVDAKQMSIREFALEIGLENAQSLYNILAEKNGISRKIARLISERFPDIDYNSIIDEGTQVQIKNKGINIQSKDSTFSVNEDSTTELKKEIERLKEENLMLKTELNLYRKREETYLKLISAGTHETKKS